MDEIYKFIQHRLLIKSVCTFHVPLVEKLTSVKRFCFPPYLFFLWLEYICLSCVLNAPQVHSIHVQNEDTRQGNSTFITPHTRTSYSTWCHLQPDSGRLIRVCKPHFLIMQTKENYTQWCLVDTILRGRR